MNVLGSYLRRFGHSAVLWSWVFNSLRLASGILLLPLLLRRLTSADLGMYYVFVSLLGLVPVLDAAVSFNLSRFVSYGMAGAQKLQPYGLELSQLDGKPNYELLRRLLATSRVLYRYLALAVVLILGVGGTAIVAMRIGETSSFRHSWIAWAIAVVGAGWEVYSGWWNAYLRGMNQVVSSARIASGAYGIRLVLAGALLVSGAGLLALPLAGLVSGFVQRHFARRQCLRLLAVQSTGENDTVEPGPRSSLLQAIWPNSWRAGLKLSSLYAANLALATLCLKYLGLSANAQYGLTLQILTAVHGVSAVWVAVKWPLISQQRAKQDLSAVRRTLWPRFWLQNITYLLGAAVAVSLGPQLLVLIGSNKELLPPKWLLLMAVSTFLEIQFVCWATLVSTENRLPSLWPTVFSSLLTIFIASACFQMGWIGFGPLVAAPLAVGCLCNYWFWGYVGARQMGTTWWRFVFSRPAAMDREEKVGLA